CEPGAWTDYPLTHPVECLQVELLGGLGRDELHRRALHRLGDRLGVAEVILLPPRIWAHVFRRHQPSGVAKRCEFAAQVMRANTGFHANQARRHGRQPCFHLATRPLLPQHDRTALIETNNVERVLADIDADHGNRSVKLLRHGLLLVFGAPCQLRLLAGPEHGRTIPLADMSGPLLPRCTGGCAAVAGSPRRVCADAQMAPFGSRPPGNPSPRYYEETFVVTVFLAGICLTMTFLPPLRGCETPRCRGW